MALYSRKPGTAPEEELPAGIADLAPQQQQMVKAQIRQLRQIEDPARLGEILEQIGQQKANAPPEFGAAIGLVEQWLRDRIRTLGETSAATGGEGGGR